MDEFEQSDLDKETNYSHNTCYQMIRGEKPSDWSGKLPMIRDRKREKMTSVCFALP